MGDWNCVKMDASRHPNITSGKCVIPGAVTQSWLDEMARRWGTDSPEYIARCRGEFPDTDASHVFRAPESCVSDLASCDGKALPRHQYALGFDLAKEQDYTWGGAIDIKSGAVVAMERWRQVPWPETVDRILSWSQRFKGQMWIDATGVGDPIYDELIERGLNVPRRLPAIPGMMDRNTIEQGRRRPHNPKYGEVIGYKLTNESKRRAIIALQIALEYQAVFVPGHPGKPDTWPQGIARSLMEELQHYEQHITPGGTSSYSAPEGEHDDGVIFLALANMARENYSGPADARVHVVDFHDERPARVAAGGRRRGEWF